MLPIAAAERYVWQKLWDDSNDNDVALASIVVKLLANGVEVQHKTVTMTDNWGTPSLTCLSSVAIQELPTPVSWGHVPDYTTSINGFEITNQHALRL